MGVKISELNETSSVQNSDVLPIVQNGETKKVSAITLFNDINNEINGIQEQINPTSWTNASLQSVLSGGTVRYTKIGNLVILTIRNLTSSNILTGGTTLVKGLPKPVIQEQFLISNLTTTNPDLNCLVGISTSGDLSIISDTMYASGAQYFGQFVYLTNE